MPVLAGSTTEQRQATVWYEWHLENDIGRLVASGYPV